MLEDKELVKVLKALADAGRLKMIQEVAAAGELSCGQVAEHFDVSQPTISHHLKILKEAGILHDRQEGKHHYISVNHALLNQVAGLIPVRLSPEAKRRKKI
jgi:ArsR family transcriptional regulator, arsenate/arsenite/antimonite-responsive transcriptional repressor